MCVQWVKQYHGPKSRSGHVCQNIAWTRLWGLVLYKVCIGVWKAARPPEGGPTEVGGLSASNLPLVSILHPTRMPDGPAKRPGKYIYIYIYILTPRCFLQSAILLSWNLYLSWHICIYILTEILKRKLIIHLNNDSCVTGQSFIFCAWHNSYRRWKCQQTEFKSSPHQFKFGHHISFCYNPIIYSNICVWNFL